MVPLATPAALRTILAPKCLTTDCPAQEHGAGGSQRGQSSPWLVQACSSDQIVRNPNSWAVEHRPNGFSQPAPPKFEGFCGCCGCFWKATLHGHVSCQGLVHRRWAHGWRWSVVKGRLGIPPCGCFQTKTRLRCKEQVWKQPNRCSQKSCSFSSWYLIWVQPRERSYATERPHTVDILYIFLPFRWDPAQRILWVGLVDRFTTGCCPNLIADVSQAPDTLHATPCLGNYLEITWAIWHLKVSKWELTQSCAEAAAMNLVCKATTHIISDRSWWMPSRPLLEPLLNHCTFCLGWLFFINY